MKVLLTGVAGFIGFHTAKTLLQQGHQVLGYDSVNDYYDPALKRSRLALLQQHTSFQFVQGELEDREYLTASWKKFQPSHIIHLAAQAGVRYSVTHPHTYISSNIVGFQNILELVRETKPEHFVYASSSSVYGSNKELPFSESQHVEHPISLYAMTKLANELAARTYAHLYNIPATGLRFFTVYGPYGRPDMAMFSFCEKILRNEKIPVFNHGKMFRDFTYIDDIVDGILRALAKPERDAVYNLGRGKQEKLLKMIEIIETCLQTKAELDLLPLQAGDVESTSADIRLAQKNLGYAPKVTIEEGIPQFIHWYRTVYRAKA